MATITSQELRKKFLDFFRKKNHQIVSSSSLIPADSTVLFTSAGMQQFIPYFTGEVVPLFKRAASIQKCFRTSDIEEVGDEFHHTFFEMLGNWSFGDYFKKEAIDFALEFLIKELGIKKEQLYITVFKGEKEIKKDEETAVFWQEQGIPSSHIFWFSKKENFWGPVGQTGPCGPCSEIHFDRGGKWQKYPCTIKGCGPNCKCGRFVEIWNLVFIEYNKLASGKLEKLKKSSIDTGIGLERLTCVLNELPSNYETDLFADIVDNINSLAKNQNDIKAVRIIADHLRAAVFLIKDGVLPGKEERAYVLRRLIRRAIRYGNLIEIDKGALIILAKFIIQKYQDIYPEIGIDNEMILTVLENEEEKFSRSLKQGLKKFKEIVSLVKEKGESSLKSKDVFHLYDTYGFPFELTQEMAKEENLFVSREDYEKEFSLHQVISRAGAEKKFGGVGHWGEEVASLHTATHLLQAALRIVLGNDVHQAGSDITPERLRFDFNFNRKLTPQEIKKIENIVREKIKENLPVNYEEMPYEEAIKTGALAFFKERYPKIVKVYTIGKGKNIFSKEICAGPHVKNTGEIGDFHIIKQESIGANLLRLKGTVPFSRPSQTRINKG